MAELSAFCARRVVVIAAIAGALVGGLVAGGVAAAADGNDSGTASPSGDGSAVATAAVVRTTLTNTVQVGGSIGYDGSYAVAALRGGGGVYTWLPEPGEVIRQDQPVYSVGNQQVPLLYGSVPAYREFDVGMSDGADVGQLTRDLIALGYGPIRVTSVTSSVGSPSQGGTVVTATSTTPNVVIDLDVSEDYLVKPGDAVTVVLPDGTSTVGGHIETVGTVATCPGGGGIGTASGSGGESPCSSNGSDNTPTVTVTIGLDSTPSEATLDQAPVNVNITTQRVGNVLAVPVSALLALAGGGYGVDVVTGKTSHLTGVTTGLYSDTLVQVSGSGITAGTLVEVPSS
jgi:hypothetical protein